MSDLPKFALIKLLENLNSEDVLGKFKQNIIINKYKNLL